jgi:hypothetical protein
MRNNNEASLWKSSSTEQSLSLTDLIAASDRAKDEIPSKIMCEPNNQISLLNVDAAVEDVRVEEYNRDIDDAGSTASLTIHDVFESTGDTKEREGDKAFTSLHYSQIEAVLPPSSIHDVESEASKVNASKVDAADEARAEQSSHPRPRLDSRNTAPRIPPRSMVARISKDKQIAVPVRDCRRDVHNGSRTDDEEKHTRSNKKGNVPTSASCSHHDLALKWIQMHHKSLPASLPKNTPRATYGPKAA